MSGLISTVALSETSTLFIRSQCTARCLCSCWLVFAESFPVADDLPWHKANKIIPHIDVNSGNPVLPTKPNGYKFERFVFDVLPFAKHSLVVETKREEEFGPI